LADKKFASVAMCIQHKNAIVQFEHS